MPDALLQITIGNKQEIELIDLASSMASLSDEYYRFLKQKKRNRSKSASKLYVKRVAEGSIILDLCEKAAPLLPGITPLLIDYSSFLVNTIDYLTGRQTTLPAIYKYLKEDFFNFKKILEPTANFTGNTINLSLNFGGTIINNAYTSIEASAAQNQCDREIKKLEKSGESLIRENVELELYQARDSKLSKTTQGNLGIISEISEKPKVLSFSSDRLRYDVTKGEDNPFNFAYSVDVEVQLKEGSSYLNDHSDIKGYEILKLHGSIEKTDLLTQVKRISHQKKLTHQKAEK